MSLLDGVRVDICGVTTSVVADGVLEVSEDGAQWLVSGEIEGWDAPAQRGSVSDPTGLSGVVQAGAYHGGRQLIVRGEVWADTREDAWAAYYRATGGMPGLGQYGDLIVYEDVPKMLRVTQGAPPIVTSPVGGFFTFELTLLAEYPYKTTTADEAPVTILAGDDVTFTGGGNWPAEIVVTTTSSGTVDLEAGGLALTSSTVPSGTVFDSRDFTVTGPGGEDLFDALIPGFQWPAVIPASNTYVQSGTANLALVRRKTFS